MTIRPGGYCTSCGAGYAFGQAFCGSCGRPTAPMPPETDDWTQRRYQQGAQRPTPDPGGTRLGQSITQGFGFGLGCLILIVLIVLLAVHGAH